MMSAPDARTSCGFIALTVAAVPTGMKAGVRMSPRCMEIVPWRAFPSVLWMVNWKRGMGVALAPHGHASRGNMVSEADQKLREMAAHRGLKLIRSRRRKEGGDYGLFGLKDAEGKPVLGVESTSVSATYEEVEDYLRDQLHADWTRSA